MATTHGVGSFSFFYDHRNRPRPRFLRSLQYLNTTRLRALLFFTTLPHLSRRGKTKTTHDAAARLSRGFQEFNQSKKNHPVPSLVCKKKKTNAKTLELSHFARLAFFVHYDAQPIHLHARPIQKRAKVLPI